MKNVKKILASAIVGVFPAMALPIDKVNVEGRMHVEVTHQDGTTDVYDFSNAVTTAGKNALFDSFFRNQAQPATWYIGLIDNAGFTATAVTDTSSAHTGWAELTDYTQAVRQTWTTVTASGGQITNTSAATFTINATVTARGIFVISDNTKGGATGTLWTTALFPAALSLVNTDSVKITYTVGA
jgi:hypothetical protein